MVFNRAIFFVEIIIEALPMIEAQEKLQINRYRGRNPLIDLLID